MGELQSSFGSIGGGDCGGCGVCQMWSLYQYIGQSVVECLSICPVTVLQDIAL